MNPLTVIPGVTLTEPMYQAAEAALAEHAPDLGRLTWERFVHAPNWALIPDGHGDGYKAEYVLLATRERTLKLNSWYLPDLRGGDQARPHSHPWPFESFILLGGYTEDRYEPTDTGQVGDRQRIEHQAGTVNAVDRTVYHEVTQIHDPAATLTLMVCGAGERAAWGYLDVSRGTRIPVEPDPLFAARFQTLNPHLRHRCVPARRPRRRRQLDARVDRRASHP